MASRDNQKLEKAARETATWYKDIVDHARDLIQCVDSKGRLTYVNQAWLATLNYTADEVEKLTLWDVIHPDSMEHCKSVFEQVLTGKDFGEVEAVFVAKDGTPVSVEGNVSVKLDENGCFVHTHGIFRNVGARKEESTTMKKLLELSEKLIGTNLATFDYQSVVNSLLELSGAKFVAINTYEDNRTKTVTRAIAGIPSMIEQFSEILGFKIAGQTWEILPERLRIIEGGKLIRFRSLFETSMGQLSKSQAALLQKISGVGDILVLELAYGDNDTLGDIIFFMSRGKEIQNQEAIELFAGQLGAVLGRLRTENELRLANENMTTVLENTLFGVVVIDKTRTIRWANPVACRLAQVGSPEELIGRQCGDYLCPAEQNYCPVLDRGQVLDNSEKILRRSDGIEIPILKTVNWIVLEGEEVLLETFIDISDRKKAQDQINDQKERLANIVEGASVGTWQWNVQTGETIFNEKWANIIGYSLEELLPVSIETWISHTHPDDLEASNQKLEAHFKGETESYNMECRMKHKQGHWVWINDRGKVISWTEDGLPLWVFGTHVDITERKEAEEALRKSEQELKTVTENMTDIVAMADPDGNFTYLSESNYRLLGYRPNELLGKSIMELIHEDDLSKTVALFQEAIAGGKRSARVEYRVRKKEGGYIWVETIGSLLLDNEGQSSGALFTSRDITDRKQTEEALKESEKKHREILEAMEEGYYEVDLAGNLVFCNEAFCKMTGYSNDDLIGQNYKLFYDNPQAVFQAFNQVYKTGNSVTTADWPTTAKGGHKSHLELSISLRRDEKGDPIGFRGVVRNITERRQADEKIRYLSFHDQLTGLYNRHFLEEEMKRLDTERQLPISIIMVDLNGLKLVNDTYGHYAGDEMLKSAAEIMRITSREGDLLARFGGDEFVLYLPRTQEKEARKISERIEKACRNKLINDVPLSLSTGVAVKTNTEQNLFNLLKEAEDNMYRDKLTESRSGKSAVVSSLLQTLAAKSFETEAHTRNMQEAAKNIGEKLGLPTSELHRLSLLITLHDIGKINIPEELLTKKGSLSAAEWEIMKKHSETGYRISKATDSFAHVAEDILAHHEKWDGSGYPQGLKREAIPLLARITAISDAYEVMSYGRPYKKAMSKNEIITEFRRCSGTHFDPELVEIFLSIIDTED